MQPKSATKSVLDKLKTLSAKSTQNIILDDSVSTTDSPIVSNSISNYIRFGVIILILAFFGLNIFAALGLLTDYAKQHAVNVIVIGQVTKDGKMAGSNKLKHMVDSHIHLSVEQKDQDLKGCRVIETLKNRFGGAGHIVFLNLTERGFTEVARISAN